MMRAIYIPQYWNVKVSLILKLSFNRYILDFPNLYIPLVITECYLLQQFRYINLQSFINPTLNRLSK